MKKPGMLIMMVVVSVIVVLNYRNRDTDTPRLLEANLAAAIDLENRFITSCGEVTFDFDNEGSKAPLFDGLGDHTFSISNSNKEAQIYFNQGINLTYGFNHTEAHRSFKEASRLSSNSPMTYWGQAYALSPNINDSKLDEKRKSSAAEALQKAMNLLDEANGLEIALINALNARFVKNDSGVIEVQNEAYRMEMKKVVDMYPDHPDVLTLYAASVMNTMPWDYWDRDLSPRDNTLEARQALERAITLNPKHPGAHHYYIHLTELPFPELAAKSGDALVPLMPGAGHMVHMPSHAYIRVGRYKDAAEANIRAIQADESYISQCYSQGIYPLGYYPHNIHFLWSAATFLGDSETALAAAKKTAEKVVLGELAKNTFMQEFASIPIQAYIRFGKWNEVLTVPYPGNRLKHLKIFWHYGRGLAFIRKGILYEAEEELDSLKSAMQDDSYKELYASINHSGHVASIAYHVVAAELAAAKGDTQDAQSSFKMAVMLEDSLIYTEPPSWHLSTRLNYGAFLIKQKDYQKAQAIYKSDIQKWGKNGWSLIGLYQAYNRDGNKPRADETIASFKKAWQYSDIQIKSSVY